MGWLRDPPRSRLQFGLFLPDDEFDLGWFPVQQIIRQGGFYGRPNRFHCIGRAAVANGQG